MHKLRAQFGSRLLCPYAQLDPKLLKSIAMSKFNFYIGSLFYVKLKSNFIVLEKNTYSKKKSVYDIKYGSH
jgi:hypothetical protein